MMDDRQLLEDFCANGSEPAFAELVRRHAPHVHASAWRQLRDPHLAQDVTQAVFLALAKKARQLKAHHTLGPWLHRATRLAVLQLLRGEHRRRTREIAASFDPTLAPDPGEGWGIPMGAAAPTGTPAVGGDPGEEPWQTTIPVLDEGLESLRIADREALMLRYFEDLDLREVGRRLGQSEEAAKKRVSRALERLRRYFRRRGLRVSLAGLAVALDARSAPPLPVELREACGRTIASAALPVAPAPQILALAEAISSDALHFPAPRVTTVGIAVATSALLLLGFTLLISPQGSTMKNLWLQLFTTGALLAPALAPIAEASPTLDTHFHPTFTRDGGTFGKVATGSDGSVLVSGQFDSLNDVPAPGLARITPSGQVDPTFRIPTRVSAFFAVQPDGAVLIRGPKGLDRLKSDGSPDEAFDLGTGVSIEGGDGALAPEWLIQDVAVDGSGRLLVAGDFSHVQGVRRPGLARLEANGTLDPGFLLPRLRGATAVAVQPDGRIWVAGTFTNAAGAVVSRLTRWTAEGVEDPVTEGTRGAEAESDVAGNWHPARIQVIRVLADGALIVAGDFTRFDEFPVRHFARLQPDAALDAGFNPAVSDATFLAAQPDGKVLVALTAGGTLRRLGSDGELDATFQAGLSSRALVLSAAVDNAGNLIVTEHVPEIAGFSATLRRLNAQGTADSTYHLRARSSGRITGVAPQADGTVWVGGEFTRLNGVVTRGLARLRPDGSTDTSFASTLKGPASIDGSVVNPTVAHLLRQSDGSVLVSGFFSAVGGVARESLARLQSNGALDTAYRPAVTPTSTAAYALQSDDRLLVADPSVRRPGTATSVGIARLRVDGAWDDSFDAGTGLRFGTSPDPYALEAAQALTTDTQGRVLLAGSIQSYNGASRSRLLRLSASGQLDAGFNPGPTINDEIYALAVQSKDRVVVGGSFTQAGNQPRTGLARFDADGNLDPSFHPSLERPAVPLRVHVRTLVALANGQLLVGGTFSHVQGVPRNGFARLNEDGSVDLSWNPAAGWSYGTSPGFSDVIDPRMTLATDAQGAMFLGGTFITTEAIGLIRLLPMGPAQLVLGPAATPGTGPRLQVFGDAGATYALEHSTDLRTWIPWTNVTLQGSATLLVLPVAETVAPQFYRALGR